MIFDINCSFCTVLYKKCVKTTLVQLDTISFTTDKESFDVAGWYQIKQDQTTVNLQVPAGSDLIGDDIPQTADDCNEWRTFFLNLDNQPYIPDAFFMACNEATAIHDIDAQINNANSKILYKGNIYILRHNHLYNLLGVEIE